MFIWILVVYDLNNIDPMLTITLVVYWIACLSCFRWNPDRVQIEISWFSWDYFIKGYAVQKCILCQIIQDFVGLRKTFSRWYPDFADFDFFFHGVWSIVSFWSYCNNGCRVQMFSFWATLIFFGCDIQTLPNSSFYVFYGVFGTLLDYFTNEYFFQKFQVFEILQL